MFHFTDQRLNLSHSNAKVPAQNLNIGQQINALPFLEFFKSANLAYELECAIYAGVQILIQ